MILEISNLTKSFGGVRAVDDCSFCIKEKSIVAIIGPNGAGKTTIFDLISGLISAESGSIRFDRRHALDGMKPHEIARIGIGRTFQNIRLFKELSVLENVKIGQHCRTKAGIMGSLLRVRSQRVEEEKIRANAVKYLSLVGLEKFRGQPAMSLSYGDQRRLEIARALTTEPRLLLLDEPNSGMNTSETLELVQLVRRIREFGITVLLISHHMRFVQHISDHVIVLNYGQIIAEGKPQEAVADPAVIEAYIGKAIHS